MQYAFIQSDLQMMTTEAIKINKKGNNMQVLWHVSVSLTHCKVLCLHVVHLKSFNARLAFDYPVYSMVICQVIDKLKVLYVG